MQNKLNFGTLKDGLIGEEIVDGNEVRRRVSQDMTPFLEEAALGRARNEASKGRPVKSHRKFATVPNAVAYAILVEHGLDISDPTFLHDADKVRKFKAIMRMEYPYLIEST